MRPLASFLASVSVAFLCGGCTRTYVSTGDPGIRSPDGDTRVCFTAYSAPGRPYPKRTKKLLSVCIKHGIVPNDTILFSHEYEFIGADLWADVQWSSTNAATMFVYDYPDGISMFGAREKAIPSNHIATVTFLLDSQTGRFKEKK